MGGAAVVKVADVHRAVGRQAHVGRSEPRVVRVAAVSRRKVAANGRLPAGFTCHHEAVCPRKLPAMNLPRNCGGNESPR